VEYVLKCALQPKQNQFEKSIREFPATLYGGGKGGGKSVGLRRLMLKRRFDYPGSVGYIFRATFPELNQNHILPLFREYPELRRFYNKESKTLELPNGSRLVFGYVSHASDLEKYQGIDIHDLGIEEAGNWNPQHIWTLYTGCRSAVPGVKVRLILTANPGGLAHQWLKRLFVQKILKPHEIAAGLKPEDFNFVQALVTDNLALIENDPDYVKRLEANPDETQRRAFRWGDWDISAGQFFSDLTREIHLIPEFQIPQNWVRFGAYDYGFSHPAAFGWFAVDEEGWVYQYRELIRAGMKIKDFAGELNKHPDTKRLAYIVAGHDCFQAKAAAFGVELRSPTIAEEFRQYKIYLKPANCDRKQGAARLREYLTPFSDAQNNLKSKLRFTRNCQLSFDSVSRMTHDPDDLEDVLKVDSVNGDPETGDDGYQRQVPTKTKAQGNPLGSRINGIHGKKIRKNDRR
jgi:phage terminase large subunit